MKSEKGRLMKLCVFVEVLKQNFFLFYLFSQQNYVTRLQNIIVGYVCLLKHFLYPTINFCGAISIRNLVVFVWER